MMRTKRLRPVNQPTPNPSRDREGPVFSKAIELQCPHKHPGACTRVLGLLLVLTAAAFSQGPELTPVLSKTLSRTADLPGEFQPYLSVSLHARVAGYVEKVLVDRGSQVK